MKPYTRSETKNSPYYIQFRHKNRNYQWCTGRTDYYEAQAEGMRYAAEVKLGVRLKPVAIPGKVIIQQIVDIYTEQALTVSEATRKKNALCLEKVLKASKLSTGDCPSVLTKQVVLKFQSESLKQGRSKMGINSDIRQARSIFARRCMGLYEDLALPDISGFMKQPLFPERGYQYTLPPDGLMGRINQGAQLLKQEEPGMYAAFLLAMYAGLRSGEIQAAKWTWLRGDPGSHYLDVPAMKSIGGKVPVSDHFVNELRSIKDDSGYLVPAKSGNMRYKIVQRKLSKWVRAWGFTGSKTVHELRKFLGSMFATEHGLFAAQKVLRHKSSKVTSQYYADLTEMVAPIQPIRCSIPETQLNQ